MTTRRGFVLGAAGVALSRAALARGRTPLGGAVKLHVPWSVAAIDPHALDDGAAAIFGDALFDTLYARQEGGEIVASLAESEPSASGGALRVALRQGLRSAYGRPVDAHDAAASIVRARAGGARAWLAALPAPRVDGNALVFAMTDASILVRALASPLVAVVPAGFNPARPDGTGPFRATRNGDALVLVRNANAARGPAFLDQVVVRAAPALETSLRAFEEGADDVGWLGSGYFETRAASK
jgi:peptide/nickel transport system substrate-binding protein